MDPMQIDNCYEGLEDYSSEIRRPAMNIIHCHGIDELPDNIPESRRKVVQA